MGGIKCFVPQKISVRPGLKEGLVALLRTLSDGKCHSAVRKTGLDGADDADHTFVCKPAILAALEDKCPKTKGISGAAAGKNLFLAKTVAHNPRIALSYSAVIAVIFTIICKFNETADIDVMPVMLVPFLSCQ